MSTLYKYSDYIINSQGRPVVNCNIAVLSQSGIGNVGNVSTQPGTPLAAIFVDEIGSDALPNPMFISNGISPLGNFQFYSLPGFYTLQFYGGILNGQLVQYDVPIAIAGISGGGVYGNTAVTGNANGVNTIFSLTDTPGTPAAVILTAGGIVLDQGVDYTLSGINITTTTPPADTANLQAYFTL
jgi:hypothetical protein